MGPLRYGINFVTTQVMLKNNDIFLSQPHSTNFPEYTEARFPIPIQAFGTLTKRNSENTENIVQYLSVMCAYEKLVHQQRSTHEKISTSCILIVSEIKNKF